MKQYLFPSAICLVVYLSFLPLRTHSQINLNQGLVAYYNCDDNANDQSGNQLDAQLNGDPAFVAGIAGNAIHFDGIDDFMEISSGLNFASDFTITFWVKADTNIGSLINKGEACPNANSSYLGSSYAIALSKKQTGCYTSIDSTSRHLLSSLIESGGNFDDDRILLTSVDPQIDSINADFIIFSYSASMSLAQIWINGSLMDSMKMDTFYERGSLPSCESIAPSDFSALHQTSSSLLVGARKSYCNGGELEIGSFFKGTMDEIRFYERTLTKDEQEFLFTNVVNDIDDPILTKAIKVYPVPASGSFVVSSPKLMIESLNLFDQSGREIPISYSLSAFESQVSTTFNGFAILRIQTDRGVIFRKIMLEN